MYLPLNMVVTLPLAVLIELVNKRLKTVFRTIYFLPVVTSAVAVSLIWGVIYNPTFGLLNMVLREFGLKGYPWLTDATTRVLGIPLPMLCVLVTYLWADMGYNLVIFIAGLQGIPEVLSRGGIGGWRECLAAFQAYHRAVAALDLDLCDCDDHALSLASICDFLCDDQPGRSFEPDARAGAAYL